MPQKQQRKLVFIGWSGPTSRQVAEALHGWIGQVIQNVRPWMSTENIRKGKSWNSDIAGQLQEAAVGIFCLTSENLEAQWIHFEAGAVAKQVGAARVCPYLFNVKESNVSGPLAEFQFTEATKDDTKRLVLTINETLEDPLEKGDLEEAFEVWWPKLESKLNDIPPPKKGPQPATREDRDLLEEILSVVRGLSRRAEGSDLADESNRMERFLAATFGGSRALNALDTAEQRRQLRRLWQIYLNTPSLRKQESSEDNDDSAAPVPAT